MSKILVVEDEKNIVRVVTYNLEREGYQVGVAKDGEEALERVRRETPDLIILDLMLPKVDGLEVCRQLRTDPKTKHLPIVMLTATKDGDKSISETSRRTGEVRCSIGCGTTDSKIGGATASIGCGGRSSSGGGRQEEFFKKRY